MRIAVIGGAGFIGSAVVDALLTAGHDVSVLDAAIPHRPGVGHAAVDISDPARTALALASGFDVIYLLAAVANVAHVHRVPVESAHTNVMGTAHVLEAARRTGARRVILASTTWVYALADDGPEVDERTPLHPHRVRHVYTASKLAAEMLCHAYQALYGLDVTVLRYGIPYGRRARPDTLLASLVRRARAGEPLVIQGDGTQWRRFVHVDDLAQGNVAALQERARNQTYNLDGNERVSVADVVALVRRFFPNVTVRHTDPRPGDLPPRDVSSRKALVELGWQPRVSFVDGATRYILSPDGGGDGHRVVASAPRKKHEAA